MDAGRSLPFAVSLLTVLGATSSLFAAPPGPGAGARPLQDAPALEGRVVLGADSSALAGQTVVLHRVTTDSGFAVDSAVTADDGTFRLPLPARADGTPVHIVSARYGGTLYFGPVIHGGEPPDPYLVAVYDTASATSGGSLTVRRRTLALMTDATGTRVLDVVEVSNATGRTLVGREPGAPWWRVSLPSGAIDHGVLPGGIGPEHVAFGPDEARVSASVPPSGQRLVLGYSLPSSGAFTLGLTHPVASLEVVHRGVGSVHPGGGLEVAEPAVSEGRRFERLLGGDLAAGDTVGWELVGASTGAGGTAAWVLLGLSGVLAVAAWIAWDRAGRRSPGSRANGHAT